MITKFLDFYEDVPMYGDTIVYVVKRSTYAELTEAEVVGITDDVMQVRRTKDPESIIRLTNPQFLIIRHEPRWSA